VIVNYDSGGPQGPCLAKERWRFAGPGTAFRETRKEDSKAARQAGAGIRTLHLCRGPAALAAIAPFVQHRSARRAPGNLRECKRCGFHVHRANVTVLIGTHNHWPRVHEDTTCAADRFGEAVESRPDTDSKIVFGDTDKVPVRSR